MNRLVADVYKSPSRLGVMANLENKFLSADDSWWTGHVPLYTRMVAEVPCALYVNYIASKSYVTSVAPACFKALDLPGDSDSTLFTILVFKLERARPLWAPRMFGALAPRFMQSNWRFYGHMSESDLECRPAVWFIRTVTTSLLLSAFGRRLARCFPLRRAHCMTMEWAAGRLTAAINPGGGSAPELSFDGEQIESALVSDVLRQQFPSYEDYARWVIDQHLSLATWPRERVVQDMHLDFQAAKITPLRCLQCRISDLQDFVPDASKPIDCFATEGLRVFLDNIYGVMNSACGFSML